MVPAYLSYFYGNEVCGKHRTEVNMFSLWFGYDQALSCREKNVISSISISYTHFLSLSQITLSLSDHSLILSLTSPSPSQYCCFFLYLCGRVNEWDGLFIGPNQFFTKKKSVFFQSVWCTTSHVSLFHKMIPDTYSRVQYIKYHLFIT